MIKINLFFILVATIQSIFAQNCDPGLSVSELNINNVRAKLLNNGDLWWDLTSAGYEVQKDSGRHAIFSGGLWIGGIDDGGSLSLAAQTYRQSGNDFWAGPLDSAGYVTKAVCDEFYNHWKVNKSTIDSFKLDLFATIPASINDWPGMNNPNNLFQPKNTELAPFVDVNMDGIYNPVQGDYPDIPGDQAVWWVFNDRGNLHTESGGSSLGIEVHALAYAFKTPSFLSNSTFYNYTIINKFNKNLDSVYIGLFTDFDLGGGFDDYIGSDTSRDMCFAYNGNAFDNDFGMSLGYGANPPVIGVRLLKGPILEDNRLRMTSSISYNNNFNPTGNPVSADQYYNLLTGNWRDGVPVTFGGNGRDGNHGSSMAGTSFPFMFPSDPSASDTAAWSECNSDGAGTANIPGDKRALIASGPFKLNSGEVNNITFAAIWHRYNNFSPCYSMDTLFMITDSLTTFYNDSVHDPSTDSIRHIGAIYSNIELRNSINTAISLYPNPNTGDEININYIEGIIMEAEIFNQLGQSVFRKTNIRNSNIHIVGLKLAPGTYLIKLKDDISNIHYSKLTVVY